MKIKKSALLFIILLNIIFFASPIFPVHAACPAGKTAVIGNSLAVADGGIGGKLKTACPNSQIDVFAHRGDQTDAIKKQFDQNVLNGGYNNVIIEGGFNDITSAKTPQQIESNLSYMYNAAKGKGMYVVAINIPTDQDHIDKWLYYQGKRIEVSPEQKKQRVSDVNSWIPSQGVNYVVNANSTWGNPKDVHDASKYDQVIKEITKSVPFTGGTVTPPITPTTTEVKVTCSGKSQAASEQSEEPDELVKEPVSSSNFEETTFNTTETDQVKIQEEAQKKCQEACDAKTPKWTECKAENVSAKPSSGTPPPDIVSGPTAAPYTVDAEKWGGSTLISGDTACEIWKNAFYLGISFLGVLALCGVIWGGFNYITSYGNQERITSAKASIWGSIAGMLIGLLSYLLFTLINPYVLECKIEAPFKLSVSSYSPGTTPGSGDGQGQGQGNVPPSVYVNAKKCSAQLKPSSELDSYFVEFGNQYGLDPHFLKGVNQVESGGNQGRNFGPYGDGTSVSGAGGPMQFMPATTDDYAPKTSSDPVAQKQLNTCHNVVNKNNKLSSPFNGSSATGYCNSSTGNYDPNCCTPCAMAIGSKNCKDYGDAQKEMKGCSRYATSCLDWIFSHKKEHIEMAAHFLANKYKARGSYMKAACSYQGGGADSCSYGNSVLSYFNKFCAASGGKLEE